MTLRRRRVVLATIGLGLFALALVWVGFLRSTPGNPRVHGRTLSAWFADLSQKFWFADYQRAGWRPPEMARALAAFDASGTNALPFVLSQLIPPERDPLGKQFEVAMRRILRQRVPPSRVFDFSSTAAGNLLAYLAAPAPVLIRHLEASLASTNTRVRDAAIRCLGYAGSEHALVAERLRPWLDPADPSAAAAAVFAASNLGSSANLLAEDLVRLAGRASRIHRLPEALGHCGPAASNALPAVERLRAQATGSERVQLAVLLCRLQPEHPEAMSFLRDVARRAETASPSECKPVHLARALVEVREERGRQFVPVIRDLLESDNGRTVEELGWELLSRFDPGEADQRLRSRIESAPDPAAAVHEASRLLQLQPTNAFARAWLVAAAQTNGFLALIASRTLIAHGSNPPPEVEAALQRLQSDPFVGRESQELLSHLRQLERWSRRETNPQQTP
jgi:hypothetical protein